MIDSSEERKRQLGFELQNSRVFEKRSKQVTQLDHCMMRKHVLVFKKIDSVFTLLTPRYWPRQENNSTRPTETSRGA